MAVHRITDEEVQEVQVEYKKVYRPFRPFSPSKQDLGVIAAGFANLLVTQDGTDTDDYMVLDDNRVTRYLGKFDGGSKVLFLGTGTGREIVSAKELGFIAVGTTLGSRNIDFGIKYLGLKENELLECLNEALPFLAEHFDVVAGFQVFEHTLMPLHFLLEQYRVLRMGGSLILEWPSSRTHSMGGNPHHQICYTPDQAVALFNKAGFREVKVYYEDMSPIPEKDMWSSDHELMLVIEGVKTSSSQEYINRWVNRCCSVY